MFQATAESLWDGRPSLGGVWVASPDAVDPERVILRNPENGKFVIGALFRREAFNPGPPLQISSDAAEALGILAGQPARITVTALRREEAPAATDASRPFLDANEGISATSLGATAAEAITEAEGAAATPPAATVAEGSADAETAGATAGTTAPKPGPQAPVVTADDSLATAALSVQIGIFSIENNARRAAATLSKAGLTANVRREATQGRVWWSVTAVGPGPRGTLLAKVKGLGFTDAYVIR